MITYLEKKCDLCGEVFKFAKGRKDRKFCSYKCSRENQSIVRKGVPRKGNYPVAKFVEFLCHNCGKKVKRSDWKNTTFIYCSSECKRQSLIPRTVGKRRINGEGYEQIFIPCHPFCNSGFVLFHRYIVECFLKKNKPDSEYLIKLGTNKYLSPHLVIHHIDENKLNNYVSNLYIFENQSDHTSLHFSTSKAGIKTNIIS